MKPRTIPPIWFALSLLLSIMARYAFPSGTLPGAMWRWIGLALATPAAFIGPWAIVEFHRRHTTHQFGRSRALVTGGPYRFTRNPMYLSLLIVLFGAAASMAHPAALVGPAFFFLAIRTIFIPFEEKRMAEQFGETYEIYRRRTRRWL